MSPEPYVCRRRGGVAVRRPGAAEVDADRWFSWREYPCGRRSPDDCICDAPSGPWLDRRAKFENRIPLGRRSDNKISRVCCRACCSRSRRHCDLRRRTRESCPAGNQLNPNRHGVERKHPCKRPRQELGASRRQCNWTNLFDQRHSGKKIGVAERNCSWAQPCRSSF